jgi:phospho-N-acetylmuramoyl-pentapeptide-transferase
MMFLLTSISVILQVGSYKLRKKRIFKMAPLHHHFELKGIPESKIVAFYMLITVVLCLIGILAVN